MQGRVLFVRRPQVNIVKPVSDVSHLDSQFLKVTSDLDIVILDQVVVMHIQHDIIRVIEMLVVVHQKCLS